MDNPRSAADRIRPILQAMERSIDSARSRRTCTGGRPAAPAPIAQGIPSGSGWANKAASSQASPPPPVRSVSPAPAVPDAAPAGFPAPTAADDQEGIDKTRLKARPKRTASYGGAANGSPVREPATGATFHRDDGENTNGRGDGARATRRDRPYRTYVW